MAARVGINSMIAIVCDQDAAGADTANYTLIRNAVVSDASSAATAAAGTSRVILNRQAAGAGAFNAVTSNIQPVADQVVRTTAVVAAQKIFGAGDVAQFVHTDAATHTRTIALCTSPTIPGTV